MGTFRVGEVINALYTVWSPAPALDGVRVVRSWETVPAGDREHLFIAGDGGAALGSEDVAVSAVEWPGLSPTARTEEGAIDCAVSVWTGDQDAVMATIDRAYEIVGACEDVLRLFPELHSDVALLAKITETRLRVLQASPGFLAVVVFTVTFQTSE